MYTMLLSLVLGIHIVFTLDKFNNDEYPDHTEKSQFIAKKDMLGRDGGDTSLCIRNVQLASGRSWN